MSNDKSCAHRFDLNFYGLASYPDRLVPWCCAEAPDIPAGRTTGRLRSCAYCGSMHPADVADAIRRGARGHWADFKYGWPHKAYLDGVPNPHAGMLESRMSMSHPLQDEITAGKWVQVPDGFDSTTGAQRLRWVEAGRPAGAVTHGKFYSVHLQDASADDRGLIEQHLGLAFQFDDNGGVRWVRIESIEPSQT
jgi:hypothetical protein